MLDRFDSYVYDFEERTFEGKITKMFLFSGVHTLPERRLWHQKYHRNTPWQHTLGRKTQGLTAHLGQRSSWSLAELVNTFFTPL